MKIVYVQSYKVYGSDCANHLEVLGINVNKLYISHKPRVRVPTKWDMLMNEAKGFLKMIIKLPRFKNAITFSMGSPLACLLTYRLFGRLLGRGHHLYMYNFYLHSLGSRKWVKILIHFLMNNKCLTLICQSPNEILYYRSLSKKAKISYVPYCSDTKSDYKQVSLGGGIFLLAVILIAIML